MAEREDPQSSSLRTHFADAIETLARRNHETLVQQWQGADRSGDPGDGRAASTVQARYEDLPEGEKDRYRRLAADAVKTAIELGVTRAPAISQPNRTSELLTVWSGRQPSRLTLEEYATLGKRANALGESLIAYDIANEGLKSWPKNKALLQIKALALARMGSWMQARELLIELAREADPDEETLGLLARTYKDLWLASQDSSDLERAYHAYADAYQSFPERFWTGINAATLAFARRDREAAYRLADPIRSVCLEKLKTTPADQRYWLVSTIAEASLILNDIDEAERRYRDAARIGHENIGNLITTRRNLRILLEFFSPEVAGRLSQAFEMPKVAAFTGHRADTFERVRPRLPPEVVPAVGAAIQARLIEHNIWIGYSSAASGSDILFLEALQQIGGRTHIVLPCNEEQFIEESVKASGSDWEDRFRSVVGRADEVIVASRQRLILTAVGYGYANELLYGLASVQADWLDTELVRMAVWDGHPGDGPGGTADLVSHWRAAGHPVVLIPPLADPITTATARPRPKSSRLESRRPAQAAIPGFASEIRAMIFADACRFSKLSEAQMPSFIKNFMGLIAEFLRSASALPLYLNTWGDGLFFVFAKTADAGRFAVELAQRIAAMDRIAAGLPQDLSLRIALHVGPVYRFKDPITGKKSYIGSHVNQTARIEPSTPPGSIYGSQAFVALAALEAPGEFHFEYVGRIPLAKNFGEFPMYRIQTALDRRRAAKDPIVGASKSSNST